MVVVAIENAAEKPLVPVPGFQGFEINELASVAADGEAPITSGFFKVDANTDKVSYGPYEYSQVGYVLDGSVTIGNEDGTTVTGNKGDVLTLKKGEKQEWTSSPGAKFFYVALRKASQ